MLASFPARSRSTGSAGSITAQPWPVQEGAIEIGDLGLMPALERLQLDGVPVVAIDHECSLPRLAWLKIVGASRLEVAATLPSLQELVVLHTRSVELLGEQLLLPHLTRLQLGSKIEIDLDLAADFSCMPSLAEVWLSNVQESAAGIRGASTLSQLTSLQIFFASEEARGADAGILQGAALPLRELVLIGPRALPTIDLGGAQHLTLLACNMATAVPALPLLKSLQDLRLTDCSAGGAGELFAGLAALPSLRSLILGSPAAEYELLAGRLEVRRLLPS